MHGIDAIDILQIVANVGEPVLHRLDGTNAGQRLQFGELTVGSGRSGAGDGYISAISELCVHTRLRVVGRIEYCCGSGEGKGQCDQDHTTRHPRMLATQ